MTGTGYSTGGPPTTTRPQGIPVSVVLLRREGQRITGAEFRASVPMIGMLLLGPTDRYRSGGGATHMADLLRPGVVHLGSLCKPLFNPVVERVDERGFVLSGYEIMVVELEKHQVEQVWLVRPLTAADPFSG